MCKHQVGMNILILKDVYKIGYYCIPMHIPYLNIDNRKTLVGTFEKIDVA